MTSGRNRKFLRIELTARRLGELERWAAHLYARPAGERVPLADFSHLASALLDSALEQRMAQLVRQAEGSLCRRCGMPRENHRHAGNVAGFFCVDGGSFAPVEAS